VQSTAEIHATLLMTFWRKKRKRIFFFAGSLSDRCISRLPAYLSSPSSSCFSLFIFNYLLPSLSSRSALTLELTSTVKVDLPHRCHYLLRLRPNLAPTHNHGFGLWARLMRSFRREKAVTQRERERGKCSKLPGKFLFSFFFLKFLVSSFTGKIGTLIRRINSIAGE